VVRLLFFHTSLAVILHPAYSEREKKVFALEAWKLFQDLTAAFADIAMHPFVVVDEGSYKFSPLERFVLLTYNKSRNFENINAARMNLFSNKTRTVDKISSYKSCSVSTGIEALCVKQVSDY